MNNENSNALEAGPTMSQRDPTKPWNQKRPVSSRSNGTELDEGCGDIPQAEAGKGLDHAIRIIENKGKS
jgi:hypothetical protein